MSPDFLSMLALELQYFILENIPGKTDLLNICCVSKMWCASALPFLWKNLQLSTPLRIPLRILPSPELTEHIKSLSTTGILADEIYWMLRHCSAVRQLHARSFNTPDIDDRINRVRIAKYENPMKFMVETASYVHEETFTQRANIAVDSFTEIVACCPRLQSLSIACLHTYVYLDFTFIDKLLLAPTATPLTELRLIRVHMRDLHGLGENWNIISYLKVLRLDYCDHAELLLDIITEKMSTHNKASLIEFSFAEEGERQREAREAVRKFLVSFSGLRHLAILTNPVHGQPSDSGRAFLNFDLFGSHKETLQVLLIGSRGDYPSEEVALISKNCMKLEQLGIPWKREHCTITTFWDLWTNTTITEFDQSLVRDDGLYQLPNLHTLRFTSEYDSSEYDFQGSMQEYARSYLSALVELKSSVRTLALQNPRDRFDAMNVIWRSALDGSTDKITAEDINYEKHRVLARGSPGDTLASLPFI